MKPGMVKIMGHTFPVKDELKDLGAKWDKEEKAWFISEDKLEEANAIVAAAKRSPREEYPTRPRTDRNLLRCRCPTCGTEFDQPIN